MGKVSAGNMEDTARAGGWSKKWVKFYLCMISMTFVYLAVLLISTGLVAKLHYEHLAIFMDFRIYISIIFLLLVGAILMALAILGFIATWRESLFMIYIVCSLLAFFSAMEGVVAFVGYRQHELMKDNMKENLWITVNFYNENPQLQFYVDELQTKLECCGIESYTDWLSGQPDADGDDDLASVLVPSSCCAETNAYKCIIKEDGCYSKLYEVFFETGKTILINTLAAIVLQLLGALYALYLSQKLKAFKADTAGYSTMVNEAESKGDLR